MKNIFGTDGIRGAVGKSPFNQESLIMLGNAIGVWLQNKFETPTLICAQDTRISCDWIKHTLTSSLMLHNVNIIDAGVLPTPAVFHLLKKNEFDCALVISASHNLYTDNGIKLIDRHGKITEVDEKLISQYYHEHAQPHYGQLGKLIEYNQAEQDYISSILAVTTFKQSKKITIVLDTAEGATYRVAPIIFESLGLNVITIHNHPNGKNINEYCGALHLESLKNTVLKNNADIGFAFDGDGDRIMVVSKNGEIKDGDDILALLLEHPDYKNEKIIVGTSMSNHGLAKYCRTKQIEFIRTDVGDKHVASALSNHEARLGGEQSGHIILQNLIKTGDGILVAIKLLESIVFNNNWELRTFTKFPQTLVNIKVDHKKDLNSEPIKQLISDAEQKIQSGRILIRYSGTELLLRIMVEAESQSIAQEVAEELAQRFINLE